MAENVKFIFKTLLRVPIIILVCYAILNVFTFTLSYYKMLGLSYVVMQTVVENNYLPESEREMLENYAASMDNLHTNSTLENIQIKVEPEGKQQYGAQKKIRVTAHYRFIWPLMPNEQTNNGVAARGFGNAEGSDGLTVGSDLTSDQLEAKRLELENNVQNNIEFNYVVPGLKYYPDLS